MNQDISDVLRDWEYDPEGSVRLISASDGRQVMQVRIPLGIEQYELDGRPDGLRPFGMETVVHEMKRRLAKFVREHGEDDGFSIDHEDFVHLQNEGLLFYYRYLILFHLEDYERTARDTAHNLELCSFVESYCTSLEDRASLLQYKPYILRVNALSRAMLELADERKGKALKILRGAATAIDAMDPVESEVFREERLRSIGHLKEMIEQVKKQNLSKQEELEAELTKAVENEDYERAAILRDRITELRNDDNE